MARSKPSRYEQLKRLRANSTDRPSDNVIPLAAAEPWRPNVKYAETEAGPTLCVEPKRGETHDVTFLLALPNLWKPFADGLLAKLCDPLVGSASYRGHIVYRARRYLTRYFLETGKERLTLEEVTTAVANGYMAWLTSAGENGKILDHFNRSTAFGLLRVIIGTLREHPSYSSRIPKGLFFRRNPWPGGKASRKPTTILNDEDWQRLYAACAREVSETVETITRQWQEIAEIGDSVRLDGRPCDYKDETIFRAALAKAVPGAIPDRESLRKAFPNLASALQHYHSFATVRALNPFLIDLIPFLVLLQLYTAYNTEPLLSIELDNIERQVVVGFERVILKLYKARAGRKQFRSFVVSDDPTSPSAILDFLAEWTKRIRTEAPPEHRNRLFLFNPMYGSREVRSFGSTGGIASNDKNFVHNLHCFLERHGLPATNIRELRATGLEFVNQLFSGDIRAVQAAGGHRDPQVTSDHYTSGAARQRNNERLADPMATRERWQASDGRVNPRGTPEYQDLGACTPGWTCADPYASPIPGERPGRLCGAFGACPICPLASINPTRASVLANLLALKREIEHAQTYLPAQRWMQAWAPRLARLNEYWLPAFQNPAVIEAAARLTLPRFPQLD